MKIVQFEPEDRRSVQAFLALPHRLYANVPQWVPPLEGDIRKVFDRRKYAFYRHSTAAFFLAIASGGACVGRLAVINNRRYNDYNQSATAFFYLFECEDDPAAAAGLFAAGFDWARRQGLTRMEGPRGFTVFDGFGLLVKGFEHRPAFGLPYNLPYYAALAEQNDFETLSESVSGYLPAGKSFPERIHQLSALIQQRRGLQVTRYRSRAELRALVPKLKDLYNASLGGTTGTFPITDEEAGELAGQMLWFADPRLIKIVMKDGQPVGFLFAYPDVSAAVQRCRGRLFPFGWLDLLLELRRTRWVNINGAGMVEKYRGLGGTALLFSEMQKSIVEGGFEHADLVQISTSNDKMQRELRDLGVDFYKVHRIYQRSLV